MSRTLRPEKTGSVSVDMSAPHSDEGAEAVGDRASDDHRVDLARALVGVQRFGIGDEAPDVVVEDDAVSAEQLARPTHDLAHANGAVDLCECRLFVEKDALVLKLREADHHPEARRRVPEHLHQEILNELEFADWT